MGEESLGLEKATAISWAKGRCPDDSDWSSVNIFIEHCMKVFDASDSDLSRKRKMHRFSGLENK